MIHHLWIIMDGNRRWAKARFLPSVFGHKAWFNNLRKIVKLASEKWVRYLTVWALSTDNLEKRSSEELGGIIKLINASSKLLLEFMKQWIKIQVIGDIQKLPQKSQDILNTLVEKTKKNKTMTLTTALVYWGQDEIIRAVKKIIAEWVNPETLTEEEFRKYLDTSILPIPDVIVRTWWDLRHSGFILFDSVYAEYYFTEKKWPEFDEEELDKVISFFEESKRNFGK